MLIKRTASLLLVCALCLGLGIYAEAAHDGGLISNPEFRDIRDEHFFPKSWIGYAPPVVTLSQDYARSTPYSIKISQDKVGYPYARTTITNIAGGAEYTFGVWLRTMNENCKFKFRYTCFSATGEWLHDAPGDAEYNDFTGDWAYFSETFRPPRGTSYMYLQLRIGNVGTVYCDDVSMHMTDAPERMYDFKTDGTFYYTEQAENGEVGEVSATVDTSNYQELIGETVRFTLYDPTAPEPPLLEEELTVPESGSIRFTYPLSLLSVEQKAYTVRCSMQPPETEEIVKTHTVYKFARPTRIDENGFFRDEYNEIFTPSIMYSVKLEDLDMLEKAGVNAVQGYPGKAFLDALLLKEMKCFVVLYDGEISAGNKKRISTAEHYVNTYKDHDAVLGWLVCDEPSATDEKDLEELERAYTQIRALDSEHPIVFTANNHYDVLHQYADAIIQDSYPYDNTKFTTYPYEENKQAVAETNGRPVYYLMQTFEHLNSFPKPQEVRNMQYASLWAGVKGVGYYKYRGYKGEGTILSDSDSTLWEPMLSFAEREQKIAFDIFVYNKYEKTDEAETEDYHWGVWKDGDEYFVILRNKKYDGSVTAEIPISEYGAWQAVPIGGTLKDFSSENGKIRVTADGGDVILLKAKKAVFLTEDGAPITSLSGGMVVNVITDLEIQSTQAPLIMLSLYREDEGIKECLSIRIPTYTAAEEAGVQKYYINEKIEIPEGKGKYNIKIFCWNRNLHCLKKVITAV